MVEVSIPDACRVHYLLRLLVLFTLNMLLLLTGRTFSSPTSSTAAVRLWESYAVAALSVQSFRACGNISIGWDQRPLSNRRRWTR